MGIGIIAFSMFIMTIADMDLPQQDPVKDDLAFSKLLSEIKAKHTGHDQSIGHIRSKGDAYFNKALSIKNDSQSTQEKYIEFLQPAVEYSLLLCESSGFESYSDFVKVFRGYKELGELGARGASENARTSFKELLRLFGDDQKHVPEINESVYPEYAEVLNALKDFKAAEKIWRKLMDKGRRDAQVLRGAAYCLGGWIERDGEKFIEITGAGPYIPTDEENRSRDPKMVYLTSALDIWNYIQRGIRDRGDKYKPQWWEAKFQSMYCLYRAGYEDPKYFESVKKMIAGQKLFKPDMGGPEWLPRFDFLENAIEKKLSCK